jgi:pteridine reductase
MNLRDKVVLITGGRRVGGDLARRLADRGAAVAMSYHTSRAAIERLVAEVEARGAPGLAVGADLSIADQAERAVAEVAARFGRLDALVNMASLYRRTPFATLTPADFDALIAANLAAPYHAAIAAAGVMLKQPGEDGIRGKIINLGDWATERPYKDYLPYLVAKGGLTTLTLALARELAPTILVTMVQPAMIDPPPELTAADRAAVVAATPLRRMGTPGDVNRLIVYLLEGTDFATGACFRVDGGRFLGNDPGNLDSGSDPGYARSAVRSDQPNRGSA